MNGTGEYGIKLSHAVASLQFFFFLFLRFFQMEYPTFRNKSDISTTYEHCSIFIARSSSSIATGVISISHANHTQPRILFFISHLPMNFHLANDNNTNKKTHWYFSIHFTCAYLLCHTPEPNLETCFTQFHWIHWSFFFSPKKMLSEFTWLSIRIMFIDNINLKVVHFAKFINAPIPRRFPPGQMRTANKKLGKACCGSSYSFFIKHFIRRWQHLVYEYSFCSKIILKTNSKWNRNFVNIKT